MVRMIDPGSIPPDFHKRNEDAAPQESAPQQAHSASGETSEMSQEALTELEQPTTQRFIEAAKSGNFAEVEKMLKAGFDINSQNQNGHTALLRTAGDGPTEMVRLLIDRGAEVNPGRDDAKRSGTPLIWAAQGDKPETAELLIERGAKIEESASSYGLTAFGEAAKYGRVQVMKVLIKHHADVNANGNNGVTPLMYAAQNRDVEAVRFLLANGARVNTKAEKTTALYYAVSNRCRSESEELTAKTNKIVKLLLQRGADPKASGSLALYEAAAYDQVEAVAMMLDRGADVNAMEEDGSTALLIALRHDCVDTARVLLERGADPNAGKMIMRKGVPEPEDAEPFALKIAKDKGLSEIVTLIEAAIRNNSVIPNKFRWGWKALRLYFNPSKPQD